LAQSLPFVEDFASSSTPLEWINTGPEFWLFSTNAGFDAALAGDHTPGGGTNYAWIDGSFGVDANALITLILTLVRQRFLFLSFIILAIIQITLVTTIP
jgi:hypothetical protein